MKSYTYHLYHTPTQTHYYGARYRKGCNPSELWVDYFSSSPVVHKLIDEYGADSFVATVRQTFDTREQAILWEAKFLSRVGAQHSDKWLNRHNGADGFLGPHVCSDNAKDRIRSKITGIRRSEETKRKLSESAKRREACKRANGWTMPDAAKERALQTREQRIQSGDINPYSEERNKKMAASKRGAKRHYLPDGSFVMVKPQADQ